MPDNPLPGKIFIVVDPAQDQPLALERALMTAKLIDSDKAALRPSLHIFLAVDMDNTDTSAENAQIYRDGTWFFEKIIDPVQGSGLEYTMEMSWSTDWYGSIIEGADKQQAELIMLPLIARPSGRERLFNESIWRLLRTATCPIMVVQPGAKPERKTVLAAVNFQSHKPEYQRLNELVIARAQWAAANYGADMHVVNAYKDSLDYPDRAKLATETGVDTAHIHVKIGDPDEVIAEVTKELDADMLVIGTRGRSGRWRGNTTEKIVTEVNCDILSIH